MLKEHINSDELLLMTKGEQLLDLVYIDDVVEGIIKAYEHIIKEDVAKHYKYALSSNKK
ncbi:NAD-dependent epimerase/dehydratase family protein [Caloramator sp. mosi_1]|nr:NAD-dependent epimerase/dehydratase family protein [Caloramator sp. mosi_1]WDC85741.1 NAD-dependent epimerase/dehydratase family protein [Caloramator sp. mosi_1]